MRPVVDSDPALDEEIRRASEDIRASWAWVAQLERANSPQLLSRDFPAGRPVGVLAQPVEVDWYGEPTPILRNLAQQAGWLFDELGRAPAIAPLVKLNGIDAIGVWIREVGVQLGRNAAVRVDERSGRISLEWAGEL